MKLVEQTAGVGELMRDGVLLAQVRYRLNRFQGLMEGSGLPIPGVHRIEGSIECHAAEWIGQPLTLRLEDGRVLGINVVSKEGRILSEGHGPMRCLCC